jgi:CRP-like cAMP-binding protein
MVLEKKSLRRYLSWALDNAKESQLGVLSQVPLFKGMGRKLLRRLLIDLVEKKYSEGEIVFHEGESGKALYVVLEGSVRIIKKSNPENITLAVLGSGSHFGELALIGNCTRYATAVAEKDALLLIMYKAYFDDLIRGNSAISSMILLNLAEILAYYIRHNQPERNDEKTQS